MNFGLTKSFSQALSKLTEQERKKAKITAFDLQNNPDLPGLNIHPVKNAKEDDFFSVRVSQDIRIIIYKTERCLFLCYVDHHDRAYKWAERRRFQIHSQTGAAQIIEIKETEDVIKIRSERAPERGIDKGKPSSLYCAPDLSPFFRLSHDELFSVGVPEEWIGDLLIADTEFFFEIADDLPEEATESLLHYLETGKLSVPEFPAFIESEEDHVKGSSEMDSFTHPDAQRRFRILDNKEELEKALEHPLEQWAVFLHPSQKYIVERSFEGPARVSGSAGTGKTVVALHRVAHILGRDKNAKILLATFSKPLANLLEHKLNILINNRPDLSSRVSVSTFEDTAVELFTLAKGYSPRIVGEEHIKPIIIQAAKTLGLTNFTDRFLVSEWRHVIDAWQFDTLEAYAQVPRLGRKHRLGKKQREKLWPLFRKVSETLREQGCFTPAGVFSEVTNHCQAHHTKPFTHIIIDEAQDINVPALKMIATLTSSTPSSLFFSGDTGQRIFQEPFSWLKLGIDIRGRSHTLKVNYRTSHQIRKVADGLLPPAVRDVDGIEEDRRGTVSIFNGPRPEVFFYDSEDQEKQTISRIIFEAIKKGLPPEELGVFVRSEHHIPRAIQAVEEASQIPIKLSERVESRVGKIAVGSMHSAKGLEFRHVIVMACDDHVLPDQERVDAVTDEFELDEVYDTERHLFYVACTRARERLIVSGVKPASEFFKDFGSH